MINTLTNPKGGVEMVVIRQHFEIGAKRSVEIGRKFDVDASDSTLAVWRISSLWDTSMAGSGQIPSDAESSI